MTTSSTARTWTMAAVCLSVVIMTLDITIVNVALPDIVDDLSASVSQAQWCVNAYTLAFAAHLIAFGSLSDRWGRRTLFIAGHSVFALASLACGFAPTAEVLVVARAVQGIGAAAVFGTAVALVADVHAPSDQRGRASAMAMVMSAGALASGIGPFVGGALVSATSWRWLFWMNVPLGVVAVAVALFVVPRVSGGGTRDVFGPLVSALLAAIVVFGVSLLLVDMPSMGVALGLAALVVAAAVVFVRWQSSKPSRQLVDFSLFRVPTFGAAVVVGLVGRAVGFGLYPFLVLWASIVAGLSAWQIGALLLVQAVLMVVVAKRSAKWVPKRSVRSLMAASSAVNAVALIAGFAVLASPTVWALLPMLVLSGIAAGIGMPHVLTLAMNTVPPQKAGMASGVANTALPLGTSLGVAGFGVVWHVVMDGFARDLLPSTNLDALAGVTADLAAGRLTSVAATTGLTVEDVTSQAADAFSLALSVIFVASALLSALVAVVAWMRIRDEDRWVAPDADELSKTSAAK